MNSDKFKRQIESMWKYRDTDEQKKLVKFTMAKTMRLALEYPELAQEYFDSLCKVIPDNERITVSNYQHNPTSDAEGEEMLTVPRKKVQRAYNTSREIVKAENPDSLMYSMHTQIMCVLENIFGSKCLLDAHEDNFTSIEPKPAEQSMTDSETEHTKDEFATQMQGKFTEQDFTEAKQRTERCMASIPQFELPKQIEAQINKAMESIKAESRKQFGDFGVANADIAIPVYRQMMRLGALLVLSAGDLESEQTDSDRGDYISMTKPTDPNKCTLFGREEADSK